MNKYLMKVNSAIAKSLFLLTSIIAIFLFNIKNVYAVEITITPEAAPVTTEADTNVTVENKTETVTAATPVASVVMPTATYIENLDSHSLVIALPEKYDIGIPEYSLSKMSGYEVNVYLSEKLIFGTNTKYRDAGSGIVNLEEVVRSLETTGFGECENVVFKVNYIGMNEAGQYDKAKDAAGNPIEWSSGPKAIYKVSVSDGTEVKATTYGFIGQSVVISPTLAKGFSFKQWADGNVNNPRIERISANIPSNTYIFTSEKSVEPEYDEDGLYDSVPVTGESNLAFILIVALVFGLMGAAYTLSVIKMCTK